MPTSIAAQSPNADILAGLRILRGTSATISDGIRLARQSETAEGYTRQVKAMRLAMVLVLVPLFVAALFNGAYWLVAELMERLGH